MNEKEFAIIQIAVDKLNKNVAECKFKLVQSVTANGVDYFGIRLQDLTIGGQAQKIKIELGDDEFTARIPKDYFTNSQLDPLDRAVGADKVALLDDKAVLRIAYRILILWKS